MRLPSTKYRRGRMIIELRAYLHLVSGSSDLYYTTSGETKLGGSNSRRKKKPDSNMSPVNTWETLSERRLISRDQSNIYSPGLFKI